jgi:hypothetical protein
LATEAAAIIKLAQNEKPFFSRKIDAECKISSEKSCITQILSIL